MSKRFSSHHKAQELAEVRFIVVKNDGTGTNWRGKKFHDVCWKNLGESGFPDRIASVSADRDFELILVLNGGTALQKTNTAREDDATSLYGTCWA